MSQTTTQNPEASAADKPRKRRGRLLLLAGLPVLLLGAAGAAVVLVPGLSSHIPGLASHASEPPPAPPVIRPAFIELPDMSVTLPNGGHARQLRIRLALELTRTGPQPPSAEILTPRVYDALLTYLRTLSDAEVDSPLALDRIRADLYRRMDLVVGPGVVRDVLITSLVLG